MYSYPQTLVKRYLCQIPNSTCCLCIKEAQGIPTLCQQTLQWHVFSKANKQNKVSGLGELNCIPRLISDIGVELQAGEWQRLLTVRETNLMQGNVLLQMCRFVFAKQSFFPYKVNAVIVLSVYVGVGVGVCVRACACVRAFVHACVCVCVCV